jgi:hypothetical protein
MHGEHRVRLQHNGDQIFGQNDAEGHESRLKLDLSLSGAIATGTWIERTSTVGHYRGAVYHGTIQLIVSPQGRSMAGRWLGFDRKFNVNTGDWTLEWIEY